MTVSIKSPEEQEKMRTAGRLAAAVLDMIGAHVKPGVSTSELNEICHDYIVNEQKAIPAPLNYRGFPKSICTSVNHVVCHGIPGEKRLKDGDIVNIDITVIKDGYHGDTSRMFHVGKPSVIGKRLSQIARESMWKGIEQVRPGTTLGDIGHSIQSYVRPTASPWSANTAATVSARFFTRTLKFCTMASRAPGWRFRRG